jgi:hypothetical protein
MRVTGASLEKGAIYTGKEEGASLFDANMLGRRVSVATGGGKNKPAKDLFKHAADKMGRKIQSPGRRHRRALELREDGNKDSDARRSLAMLEAED